MVIRVHANILEVVVLAAGADALLRVSGALEPGEGGPGFRLSDEERLELVHTCTPRTRASGVSHP